MLFKWNKGGGRGFKSSYIYIYILIPIQKLNPTLQNKPSGYPY